MSGNHNVLTKPATVTQGNNFAEINRPVKSLGLTPLIPAKEPPMLNRLGGKLAPGKEGGRVEIPKITLDYGKVLETGYLMINLILSLSYFLPQGPRRFSCQDWQLGQGPSKLCLLGFFSKSFWILVHSALDTFTFELRRFSSTFCRFPKFDFEQT